VVDAGAEGFGFGGGGGEAFCDFELGLLGHNLVEVGIQLTSRRPWRRNCSARFWKRGAEGVMGIAATRARMAARTMNRIERIVLIVA
jgi:hypothetical protein